MLRTSKNTAGKLAGVACVVMLVISIVIAGCGGEKESEYRIRTVRKSPPKQDTQDVAVTTAPETAGSTEDAGSSTGTAAEVEEPDRDREVTYEEAEEAFNNRDYAGAVELFTLYTARKSENPWGFYMLGLSARRAGEYELAETSFERALELDPKHVKSYLNLSRVLLDTGRPAEAEAILAEAIALDPDIGQAQRLLGRAYSQQGDSGKAIDAYMRAISIDSSDAWSMNNLGLVLIGQERFEEALKPLARAVEIDAAVAVFSNNLGMALERTGHIREAENAYRAAVAADESHEKAYDNMVRLEGVLEDPSIAPVVLADLARSFVEQVENWMVASGEKEAIENVAGVFDSPVVLTSAVADSTGNENGD